MRCVEKTGKVVAIKEVVDDDELMVISQHGTIIRVPIGGISIIGRATQGVRIINLREGDQVMDVARVIKED
jgi:DNA gyrase subunit A